MKKHYLRVILNLFEGEGGAPGGTDGAPAAGEQTGGMAEEPNEGVADPSAEAQPTLEDRKKAYKDLVNSEEYKDIHTKEIQKIINRRFKDVKGLEEQVNSYGELMDRLSERFGSNDVNEIMRAMDEDDSFWENKAFEAGMDVKSYKELQQLKRENRKQKAALEAVRQHEEGMQKLAAWKEEEAKMKEMYPDFDANYEAEMNPDFGKMLQLGIPMEKAYAAIHFDEMSEGLIQVSAQKTAKAVTDHIRARGNRPIENGTSSQSAIQTKSNVANMSINDINELIKRAERGEKISL